MSIRRRDGLIRRLHRNYLLLVVALFVLLGVTGVSSQLLLSRYAPAVTRETNMIRQLRLMHEAMLDQETGLRGWLATNDPQFLEPYVSGQRSYTQAARNVTALARQMPSLHADVAALQEDAQRWQVRWAGEAHMLVVTDAARSNGSLSAFLLLGKQLFDGYRWAYDMTVNEVVAAQKRATDDEHNVLVLTGVLQAAAIVALLATTMVSRHRLRRKVESPLQELLGAVQHLRDDDAAVASIQTSGITEVDAVGGAINQLSASVRRERLNVRDREAAQARLTDRLQMLLGVARDATDAGSPQKVAEVLAEAASGLVNDAVLVWRREGEGNVELLAAVGLDDAGSLQPSAAAGQAASLMRTVLSTDQLAVPLTSAGAVIGIIEAHARPDDAGVQELLEALALQGSAALQAALVTAAAVRSAETDALTGLANRRRMDADLAAEQARSSRAGHPLSLLMLDIDRFKQLNDQLGHQAGDEWLQLIAQVLTRSVRVTDTVYRYGGEELAVLLRDTTLQEACLLGERLRSNVAALAGPGGRHITVSIGAAALGPEMLDPATLLAAADRALYDAKRAGRNRVVPAVGQGVVASADASSPVRAPSRRCDPRTTRGLRRRYPIGPPRSRNPLARRARRMR